VGGYGARMGRVSVWFLLPGAAGLMLAHAGLAGGRAVPVVVAPAVGGSATIFVVSFRAPVRTGVVGSIRLRDLLIAAPVAAGGGCIGHVSVPVPDAHRAALVRVRLDPIALGGRWCTGTYHGKVIELQTAVCPLTVRAAPGGDRTPPVFAGIEQAFACTPGPQRPGQTTQYTLSWHAASDNITPAAQIVYDIYFATTSGGEDYAHPTWTAIAGATSFRTPGLPSHGDAFFVVRARDSAGNEDTNTREQMGVDPCVAFRG